MGDIDMQNEKCNRFGSVDLRKAVMEVRVGSPGKSDLLSVKGSEPCLRLGAYLYCSKCHSLCPIGEEEGVIEG
jgi:hypothetical protein